MKAISLIVILLMVVIGGCKPDQTAKFHEGDMVTSVLSGQDGQIVRVYSSGDCYVVRFADDQAFVPGFLGGRIRKSAFTLEVMRDYELKASDK